MEFLGVSYLYLFIPFMVLVLTGLLARVFVRHRASFFKPLFKENKRQLLSLIAIFLSICFAILAISKPVLMKKEKTYSFIAMLDISQSMLCEDVGKGLSRLELAKNNLLKLFDAMPSDARLGLALAASYQVSGGYYEGMEKDTEPLDDVVAIVFPPQEKKTAYAEMRKVIESINIKWCWQGGSPTAPSVYRISYIINSEKDFYADSTVIFLTDGEEIDWACSSCKHKVSDYLHGGELEGGRLFIGGIGSLSGSRVPDHDENGQFVGYRKDGAFFQISKLNEDHLKEIVAITKGRYERIENEFSLVKYLLNDDSLKTLETKVSKELEYYFKILAFVFFALFLII